MNLGLLGTIAPITSEYMTYRAVWAEKNPLQRKITSHDVEKQLENVREQRSKIGIEEKPIQEQEMRPIRADKKPPVRLQAYYH